VTALRDYQQDIYARARAGIARNQSICIQLATGGGKTPVMAAMCESVLGKGKRAWIVVPRRELLAQASGHLRKWNVPHGIINADSQESRAFKIHVVSKDTLIRRYDRIKNWPDLMIFDEAHLYYDRQIEIISHLPESSKIIGMTATPERLDGRGLSEIYGELITGPSIPWLTERGFLSPLRYFSPPLDGLADLHVRGTDYDEEELEALLQRRKVYGEVVGHYEKYGRGRPALGFCRSVKSAYQMAERFREKGFNFHTVEGRMSAGRLRDLLDAHRNGEIDGLTTCDLVLYGVDIPRVEYGFSIRPTLSRSVYMQMIGRVLRPHDGKESAIWMDHVNMVLEHQDDRFPGVPLHYVPEISWNFNGTEKRKRDKCTKNVVLCPHLDFMYCETPHCATCSNNPDKSVKDARRPMVIVPAELEEIKPVPMAERPPEERREIQDRIGAVVLEYKRDMAPGPVGELLKIADALGRSPLWVYHQLTESSRLTINIPLLHEIARQKGYKPGWVWIQKQKLREGKTA
jgi:superfamily II DNA or RNA helicase